MWSLNQTQECTPPGVRGAELLSVRWWFIHPDSENKSWAPRGRHRNQEIVRSLCTNLQRAKLETRQPWDVDFAAEELINPLETKACFIYLLQLHCVVYTHHIYMSISLPTARHTWDWDKRGVIVRKAHLVSSSSSWAWSGGKNFTANLKVVCLGPVWHRAGCYGTDYTQVASLLAAAR